MKVKTIKFRKGPKESPNFEIMSLRHFFTTRTRESLEKDFRTDFWTLLYIIEGEGTHSIDFNKHSYKSGDLIVITRSLVHSFRVNHKIEGYIIIINEPFFFEDSGKFDLNMEAFFETPSGKPILHLDVSEDVTSRKIIDLIYKEYQRKEESSYKLLKSLFSSFVYSIRLENKEKIIEFPTLLYKHYYDYRQLVNKNFNSMRVVSDYSNIMGLSNKTINKACRVCADKSAKAIITDKIILEAKGLIVQGKLKMYEISEELGFDEPANFTNFFRVHSGSTIKDFKASQEKQHLGEYSTIN
jgi:AraC-like DNA-binding protein